MARQSFTFFKRFCSSRQFSFLLFQVSKSYEFISRQIQKQLMFCFVFFLETEGGSMITEPNLIRWTILTARSLNLIFYTIIETIERNFSINLNICIFLFTSEFRDQICTICINSINAVVSSFLSEHIKQVGMF